MEKFSHGLECVAQPYDEKALFHHPCNSFFQQKRKIRLWISTTELENTLPNAAAGGCR
jgi:hypothetical protein